MKTHKDGLLWIQMEEEEAISHLQEIGYEIGYVTYGDERSSYFIDRQFPYYNETEILEAIFGYPEKQGIIQYWEEPGQIYFPTFSKQLDFGIPMRRGDRLPKEEI